MNENQHIPLCVDLDGTLIKTDLLLESFFAMLKKKPWALFFVPLWLLKGKSYLKERIAAEVNLDIGSLPYHQDFLEKLKEERASGRSIILATASHYKYANQVASHLGIFDEVLATEIHTNLSGDHKLAILQNKFGDRGFDYAGNSRADLKIWPHARVAIVVNPEIGVLGALRSSASTLRIHDDRGSLLVALSKALRLHQWLKNTLVFIPLLASHKASDMSLLVSALLAFFTYGLCASSVYLLNDMLDLEADRNHPRKRNRAFASGNLPILYGMLLVPVLLLMAIVVSLIWLPLSFLYVLGVYYLITLAYSFWAKNRVVVDVLFLAGLYTMRIIAGAAAVSVLPSFWLLAFSMFIFLSLALVKRYSELLVMRSEGKSGSSGRGYVVDDLGVLQSLGTASGYLAVLVIALFINSPEVRMLYSHPYFLWAVCPLFLFWISRVWVKAHRGEMHDDPIVFAAKDKVSILVVSLMAGTAFLAI